MKTPDLNFLYVLQALFEDRSVSRAGLRLGLTQPAVSHALSRAREIFQDDLFVRVGAVMAPTPVGERVAMGSSRVLALLQKEIWEAQAFDALNTTRTFTVCMSDMGLFTILPFLLHALREKAPNATLKPIPLPSQKLAAALEEGSSDLAIGYLGKLGANLYQQTLFRRQLVVIVRRGTEKRSNDYMTLERFIESKHVISGTLAVSNQLLEKELRRQGAKLNVGVEIPFVIAVPSIVESSDFIAAVPRELAERMATHSQLDIFPMPVTLPDITIKQFWHALYHHDVGHRWFRALVATTVTPLIA